MKCLNVYISLLFLMCSLYTHAKCDMSQVDSLEAKDAISFLKNCETIENEYLYHIKLGDSFFRANDWANAILNYEKARKLNSIDNQLVENLVKAYSATKNGAKSLMISEIKSKKHLVTSPHISDYLAVLSILLILIIIFILFRSQKNNSARQKIFPPLLVVTLMLVSLTIYALNQGSQQAVVMNDEVSVYSSTSGTTPSVAVLNAGYKVDIIELTPDWAYVNLATNQKVWLSRNSIELITEQ